MWLRVLAKRNRLPIIHSLTEVVQCNCELGDVLKTPHNLISHHLRVLCEAWLIPAEIDMLATFFYIGPVGIRILKEQIEGRLPNCCAPDQLIDPSKIEPGSYSWPASELFLAHKIVLMR